MFVAPEMYFYLSTFLLLGLGSKNLLFGLVGYWLQICSTFLLLGHWLQAFTPNFWAINSIIVFSFWAIGSKIASGLHLLTKPHLRMDRFRV